MSRLCKHCGYNDAAPAEIWCVRCIQVLDGVGDKSQAGAYMPPAVAIKPKQRTPRAKRGSAVSDRDRDIIALLCRGLSNKQIAEALGTAISTVQNQRLAIMDRSGCSSAVQLGVWAERNGYAPRSESQAVAQ